MGLRHQPVERRAHVDELMAEFGEDGAHMRNIFAPVVVHVGWEACLSLLEETRAIEAAGGIWSVSTRERRTKGGVFLALLKSRSGWARNRLGKWPRKKKPERNAVIPNPPEWAIATFDTDPVDVGDIPVTDPALRGIRARFEAFKVVLAGLSRGLPNARVQAHVQRFWDLAAGKVLPVVTGPDVPHLTFVVGERAGAMVGRVVLPRDWCEAVKVDIVCQSGLAVYVAAEALAFVDGRPFGAPMHDLAQIWHAEYLRTIRRTWPTCPLNAVQRSHIDRWPLGLDSSGAAELLYDLPAEVRA